MYNHFTLPLDAKKDMELFKQSFPNVREIVDSTYIKYTNAFMKMAEYKSIRNNANDILEDIDAYYTTIYQIHEVIGDDGYLPIRTSYQLFASPRIVTSDGFNFKTEDAINDPISGDLIESRLTSILYRANIAFKDEKTSPDEKNSICNELRSLIRLIASVSHPTVIGELISVFLSSKNYDIVFNDTFKHEIFEYLVVREGILLSKYSDYKSGESFRYVFSILSYYMDFEPIKIANGSYNWDGTIFANPVYDKDKKEIITKTIVEIISNEYNSQLGDFSNSQDVFVPDTPMFIDLLRYMREEITAWIKTPKKEDRKPIYFLSIIDMNEFLITIYRLGLQIGDMSPQTDKLREEIEANKDNKELEERSKERYMRFLKRKSMIGFLFEELGSNADLAYSVYNIEVVSYIMSNQPSLDNAMHDVWNNVTSLFCKRDKSSYLKAINTCYYHYGKTDISSEEVIPLTKIMNALVSIDNYSILSVSGCRTYEDFIAVYTTILDTFYREIKAIDSNIIGCIKYLNIKHTEKSVIDFTKEIISKYKDVTDKNIIPLLDKDYVRLLTAPDFISNFNSEDAIKQELSEYNECINKLERIVERVFKSLNKFKDDEVQLSYRNTRRDNRPPKDFWPITCSYDIPVNRDEELSEENLDERFHFGMTSEDILSGDYSGKARKSRMSVNNPCE